MNALKKLRLWLGWCPNANLDRRITMQRENEIPGMDFNSRPPLFSSFFESYAIYLILLFVVLLPIIVSKASIEISDRSIRVKTILSPFMGSTTHALTCVDSVEVRKNNVSGLFYSFSFILGILWLFTFLLHLMEGAPRIEIIESLMWIIVSFGFGYQKYLSSKSVSNIRIRFLPHPSVNKMTIYTTNAGQIADLIETARNRNSGD